MKLKLLTLVVALLVAGALVLAGCGGLSSTAPTAPSGAPAPQPVTTSEPATPVQEGAENSTPGTVSRSQAEQAALDAVGSGRVTWSGPEDDRGAAWEVEVTRPDGSEVDVLVAADGTIIKQVEKFGRGPARSGPGIPPASGVVSREQAAQAALDAVGEGQVTWISREDERGAAWEVEITRPDGSEIDVLVAPDGSIIE
ncbi:PepSY domain-containing protein [Candidatus Chloroploca sp. Khr17]|uniref:PepSY domain-containing protein n=1 Tax=Candidatus Chloroploca sp. Khr17 TaxID=2496869 RepID=UPI00101C4D6A|nr:PepSY domain-containing protein [Candidatus Chloroploca sp. Khr17]